VRFRLAVIAESESLVNDGVAITLYTVGLRILAGGEFEPLRTAGVFAWEVAVGLAVGIAFGLAVSRLTALVDDHLIEMTLSSALAYGSYIAAESLGASGALACVAAGAVHGTYGRRVGMSVTTRGRLDDLWEYLGFAANGVLFLLVGFSANLAAVAARAGPLAVVVAAIVGARLVIVELSTRVVPPARRSLAPGERLVLVWGGLRGALTVALALALPVELAERPLLVELAFGVVLFTLLGQGLTLSPLIRWLGVAAPSGGRGEPV
jgi:CPA1 family monovalent cation:H+ antiporter